MTSLVYYGVSLNVGNFGLDIYLTQLIFGVAEIPARMGSLPLIEHFGRRICQAIALFFGGTACLVILVIPAGNVSKDAGKHTHFLQCFGYFVIYNKQKQRIFFSQFYIQVFFKHLIKLTLNKIQICLFQVQ